MLQKQASKLFVGLGILTLVLGFGLTPALSQTGEVQDFALFYEALAPYGKWIDYGKYGPVWFPTGVSEDWRPYLNGRWVPTEAGWVFETEEPWGWATYHYGNWFPTIEYGWVWSPGSTWYPSTAVWRTSDEYIGWAPLPPPDYEPVPAFYPETGYYPGAPLYDLLTPPFWTFSPASSFLLGFGQPYLPAYSYWNCGCLAPFLWSPFLAFRTYFLPDIFFSSFAPNAFFAFGPSFPFISRVAGINIIVINQFVKDVHFRNLKNVLPPNQVLASQPFIRRIVPAPVLQGQRFAVTPVQDRKLAEANLLRPDAVRVAVNLPRVSREIPRAIALPHRNRLGPEALKGVRGMSLPERAVARTAPRVAEAPLPRLSAPSPSPPAARQAPTLERREEAGARVIEIIRPAPAGVAVPGRQTEILRGTPSSGIPSPTLRQRRQEQTGIMEQGQQRLIQRRAQERQQVLQPQLRQQEALRQQEVFRQQEVLREQQRLLQQRQQRRFESLQRQQEQIQLQRQLEQRQLRRQQQFRLQPQPPVQQTVPARPQLRTVPQGRSPAIRQTPLPQVQPRQGLQSVPGRSGRSLQSPGAPIRSFSGRGAGGQGRSPGSFGGGSGMGFDGLRR
ncbi:MAG: hypothetical protein QME75_14085 [Deltaproteobacteria bacterium]|nr:hypothetical protein [Deltaproteobacteria bacterium]